MKILVITSRFTANRDIISDNFGRQMRILEELKKYIDITVICADYRKFEKKDVDMEGMNILIRPFNLRKIPKFLREIYKVIKTENPDVILSTGDPSWGILGYLFSKIFKIKLIYDLQDNYETYDIYKIPIIRPLDSMVIKNSDIVLCVSQKLKRKIERKRGKPTYFIPNGIDLNIFTVMDKTSCRKKLGIPLKIKLISYTGSLEVNRGLNVLIESFFKLKKDFPNLKILFAGRGKYESKIKKTIPKKDLFIFDLPWKKVPIILNSSDVLVIPNPSSEFSEFCFPYKLLEYMSSNKPIVATKVGDAEEILSKFESSLCKSSDSRDMTKKIKNKLESNDDYDYRSELGEYTWERVVFKLNKIIESSSK